MSGATKVENTEAWSGEDEQEFEMRICAAESALDETVEDGPQTFECAVRAWLTRHMVLEKITLVRPGADAIFTGIYVQKGEEFLTAVFQCTDFKFTVSCLCYSEDTCNYDETRLLFTGTSASIYADTSATCLRCGDPVHSRAPPIYIFSASFCAFQELNISSICDSEPSDVLFIRLVHELMRHSDFAHYERSAAVRVTKQLVIELIRRGLASIEDRGVREYAQAALEAFMALEKTYSENLIKKHADDD